MRRLLKILREPETTLADVPESGAGATVAPPATGPRARDLAELDALAGTPLAAARDHLDRLARCGVRTRVTVRGSFADLPAETADAARVVLDEALAEAESESDGSIDVRLRQDDAELTVSIYSLPRPGEDAPTADRRRLADAAVRGPVEAARGSLMSRRTTAGWIVSARFPLAA